MCIRDSNISRHLSSEDNNITVIDHDEDRIQKISSKLDVRTLVGYASHPNVLSEAGAEEADILISMAKTQGTKLAVHHQSRSGGALDAICETIQKGEIGDIRHIYASGKGYYGGYGLLNIRTHLISYILRLTGHCRSVVATATRNGRQIEPKDVFESPRGMGLITGEKITATMVFDQGVTASLLHLSLIHI